MHVFLGEGGKMAWQGEEDEQYLAPSKRGRCHPPPLPSALSRTGTVHMNSANEIERPCTGYRPRHIHLPDG
jgi:hypothetical protein